MIGFITQFYHQFFSKDKAFFTFLSRTIGESPKSMSYYHIAFSHRSSTKDYADNNERLELLGDAVITLVFSEYLFKKYPYKDEGFLTTMRSKLVNRNHLNKIGQKLQLNTFLITNHQFRFTQNDLFGNLFEAFVGAIYLDMGYNKAKTFLIDKIIKHYVDFDEVEISTDYKSEIYIYAQKQGKSIDLRVIQETKISNRNYYIIELWIGDEKISIGEGHNKKIAEQEACRKAMEVLEIK